METQMGAHQQLSGPFTAPVCEKMGQNQNGRVDQLGTRRTKTKTGTTQHQYSSTNHRQSKGGGQKQQLNMNHLHLL